jgi:quercetin dioxygenase-like cupin family protein
LARTKEALMTSTAATPAPFVRAAGEGDRRWFYGGGVQTWKVGPDEVDGAFMIFEHRSELGKMTPLHTHSESDETMIMLEGEILMHLDGVDHRVGVGGIAVAPRGVPHAFLVTSAVARMLCLHTPGSCEAFYVQASEPVSGDEATGPVDFDRIRDSAHRNGGIEILGPPPFPPA